MYKFIGRKKRFSPLQIMRAKFGARRSVTGFSLIELIFVAVLSMVVVGVILSAWMFTSKTGTFEREHTYLRVGIMEVLETIKDDLRLSSLTHMVLYPEGAGPYTAVSFPAAELDGNGLFFMDGTGNIDWNETVVYYTDGGNALRRAVFDPRDDFMSETGRYTQIAETISGAVLPAPATDVQLLDDVDIFEISPILPIVNFYDSSATTPIKVGKVVFGWVKLSAGPHTIRFQLTEDTTRYDIGIDNIMLEPSGSVREVEHYSGAAIATIGGTASLVQGSIWGNNNYLEFDGSSAGDYIEFTDYYDLWRESAFENTGLDNTRKAGNEVYVELDLPGQGETGDVSWLAYTETGDPVWTGQSGDLPWGETPLPAISIRTVLTQGNISNEGDMVRVSFKASSDYPLVIDAAYITKRNGTGANGFANQDTSLLDVEDYHRHQQLFFRDNSGNITPDITIPVGSEVWSIWTAFPLRTDSDYLISVHISDTSVDEFRLWVGGGVTNRTYYKTSSTADIAGTPDWTLQAPFLSSLNVYITSGVEVASVSGTVTSKIFDTTLGAPSYSQIKWSETVPAGTDVEIKVRSSVSADMIGATDWSLIAGTSNNPDALSIGSDRYVQFLAELSGEISWETSTASLIFGYEDYIDTQVAGPNVYDFPEDGGGDPCITQVASPWVDDIEIDWPGDDSVCAITGYIAKKDTYGQVNITVDGEALVKNLRVYIRAQGEVQGRPIVTENYVEVQPRNTGK